MKFEALMLNNYMRLAFSAASTFDFVVTRSRLGKFGTDLPSFQWYNCRSNFLRLLMNPHQVEGFPLHGFEHHAQDTVGYIRRPTFRSLVFLPHFKRPFPFSTT